MSLAGKIGLGLLAGGYLVTIHEVERSGQRTIDENRRLIYELRRNNLRLTTEITDLKNKYEPMCSECRLAHSSKISTPSKISPSIRYSSPINPHQTFF